MNMFKKLRKSKKADAMVWIYSLVFLMALGVIYTTFTYVLDGKLVPIIKDIATNTISDPAKVIFISGEIDKYMAYFHMLPFILFAVVVTYMFVNALFRQSGTQY